MFALEIGISGFGIGFQAFEYSNSRKLQSFRDPHIRSPYIKGLKERPLKGPMRLYRGFMRP